MPLSVAKREPEVKERAKARPVRFESSNRAFKRPYDAPEARKMQKTELRRFESMAVTKKRAGTESKASTSTSTSTESKALTKKRAKDRPIRYEANQAFYTEDEGYLQPAYLQVNKNDKNG